MISVCKRFLGDTKAREATRSIWEGIKIYISRTRTTAFFCYSNRIYIIQIFYLPPSYTIGGFSGLGVPYKKLAYIGGCEI
jgi:hypothetical protein